MLKDFKKMSVFQLMHSGMTEYVQLTLYYLFMNADGICTENELDIFNDIYWQYRKAEKKRFSSMGTNAPGVTGKDLREIRESIDSIGFTKNADNSAAVIAVIEKMLGLEHLNEYHEERVDFFVGVDGGTIQRVKKSVDLDLVPDYSGCSLKSDKVLQIQTLWNLINIGYADEKYTYPQGRVIDYLAAQWKIDKPLYLSMIDTAETMLLLVAKEQFIDQCLKQRKETGVLSQGENDRGIREMEKMKNRVKTDIEKLKKDIDITINETNL